MDLISEINSADIRDFDQAIDFKYYFQNKLVSLWFSHSITTQDFMYYLTLMYEKIMDQLILHRLSSFEICVIGFGKIGSKEINFSSDIDVCFVFKAREDEEKVIREVRNFLRETNQIKGGRFIWRLDLDLRPGGRASPVAVSDSFFSWYYLNLGKIDDRYSLLRARPFAGRKEIGERVLKEIEPFVFRKYLDFSVIERLKEIKILISRHIRSEDSGFDVKYSKGGIREIEFVVFANQLMFGGKDLRFREKSTTKILEILEKEFIKKSYGISLKDCYIFLRELESLVQLNEEYRFNITEKDIPRILEFYGIGYDQFSQKLNEVRSIVSDVFRETFEVEEPEYKIITESSSDEDIEHYLSSLNYKDVKSASGIIKDLLRRTSFLKERQRVFMYDQDISESISPERIISYIVWHCSKVKNSDSALSYISSFLHSVGRRRGIYTMLFKNENLLKTLLELMSRSRFFSNFLIRHPESIDTIFLSGKREILPEDENKFWERVKNLPTESVLDEIRRQKKEKILITVLDDISMKLDIFDVSHRITAIYDFVVRQTVSLTAKDKIGLDSPPADLDIPYVVIAIGKYGSEEAIYGSDADILLSFYDGEDFERWIKFSQRFLNFLVSKTNEGEGLQVDMRLRPSGRAGPIALSQKAFSSFYLETQNIWEIFPLLKARVVFDGYGKYSDFLNDLKNKAFGRFEFDRIKKQMLEIREKSQKHLSRKEENGDQYLNIKYCDGGLYDFELIVFFSQIKEKIFYKTFKQALGEISSRLGLVEAYKTLRRIEKFIKIRSDVPLEDVWIPENPKDKFWEELEASEKISYDDFLRSSKIIHGAFKEFI